MKWWEDKWKEVWVEGKEGGKIKSWANKVNLTIIQILF